jgi:hypothetical protein
MTTSLILFMLQSMPAQAEYTGLICRGVEESGRLYIGQPGFGPHLISLFVTGPNPLSATHTLAEHIAWVNDPLHSYVADGTGGMVIFAHPGPTQADFILSLEGLTGVEVNYCGDALSREALWDEVLSVCAREARPFIWGFGNDDTHSSTRANLSWFAARLSGMTEFALKKALREGAFYISNGPIIDDVQVTGRTITLRLPEPADVLWLRDGQHLGTEAGETVVSTEAGTDHCLQWDREVIEASFDCADATGALFVRAVVKAEPGGESQAETASRRTWAASTALVAQTQPFRIGDDGTVANPYPSSGQWVRGQSHNHSDAKPGDNRRIAQYRLDYQAFGQLASFSTDYSYWESPYQWLPSDGTPQILAVQPDRVPHGSALEAVISGVNLAEGAQVQIAGRPVAARLSGEELHVSVSANLPPGIHDLTVTNPDGFRDTLAQGFTIQEAGAPAHGWTCWTEADGLPHPQAIAVAAIGDDVYACTINGVGCYRDGAWTTEGLPRESTYSVVAGSDGVPWIAGGSGLHSISPDGTWVRHQVGQGEKLASGKANERWGRLALDAHGQIWAGHRWNGGLGLRRTDGTWERLSTVSDSIPSDAPTAVATDTEGTLWVGFSRGLYRLIEGAWEKVVLPEELRMCRFVIALEPDADGGMWAAVTENPGQGGVAHFDAAGRVSAYSPDNSLLPSTRVRDVLVTSGGDAWFASDMGVAILGTDGAWHSVTSLTSGLGCNIVLGLAEGPDGSIWFATARGVSRYEP